MRLLLKIKQSNSKWFKNKNRNKICKSISYDNLIDHFDVISYKLNEMWNVRLNEIWIEMWDWMWNKLKWNMKLIMRWNMN